jgi:DNA helicase-2/ATP-dependent DNA helicase PcrA
VPEGIEPDDRPEGEQDVHVFSRDGAWHVEAAGESERFEDRSDAMRSARDAARRLAPSRLVLAEPGAEHVALAEEPPPGAEPSVALEGAEARPAASVSLEQLAGPDLLGRCLLLRRDGHVPDPWASAERRSIGVGDLDDPELLRFARAAYLERRRVVYVLDDGAQAPARARLEVEPYDVAMDLDLVAEDCWELLSSNAVDARGQGEPWPLRGRARSLGAAAGQVADVTLPDGGEAWVDGGPLRLWSEDELAVLGARVVPAEALDSGRLGTVSSAPIAAALAPDQLAAVADPSARARIIAPAGSGKTRVLTERARHLLRSGVPPSSLLLVAFNKRAQLEMRERTDDLAGLQVQTLNALALGILNRSQGSSTLRTIDEREVRDLLSSLVTFPRRANTDPAASWIDALSMTRLGLVSPREVEAQFNGDVDGFTEVFPRYRAELRRRGAVDFDEQIYLALERLLAEPELRVRARRSSAVLLVDELQDLTPAHMLLLRLLSGPRLSIFGVGDDDQTIYGYSGASPRWLVDFDAYIPAAAHHDLEVNYRCPAQVVEAARNLLSHNEYRVSKQIRPGPAASSAPIEVVQAATPARAVADLVAARLGAGCAPSEIAVLTRVNTLLAPVQAALVDAGVPVENREGGRFLERSGVDAALSWFRLGIAEGALRSADLQRAARRPSRGISPKVGEWIGEQRDLDGIERLAGRLSDERSAEKVRAFAADLERLQALAGHGDAADLLEFIRTGTGLDRSLQALDAAHRGRNSAAHSDDLRALVALGRLHPDPSSFEGWLRRVLESGGQDDGVVLATVHKVKGLEWRHVIVADASQGIFPHRLSSDVEEERRVFHVALTRAVDSLAIVADEAGGSLFLGELAAPAPARPRGPASPERGPRRGASGHPAAQGLALTWGGYDCVVSSLGPDGVQVGIGSATLTIPYGSEVLVDGRAASLDPPARARQRSSAPSSSTADALVVEALKAWRLERSRRDKVPAYVVAHNKTLEAIAEAMPADELALLDVAGMGANRVEAYGDELLAVLDAVRSGT